LRPYTVAASVFGGVQRGVGGFDQRIGGSGNDRVARGAARAHGDEAARSGGGNAELLDGGARAFGKRRGFVCAGVRQHQREFLAAIARDETARLTQRARKRARYGAEACVAVQMAEGVVVAFEVIDVDHDERERPGAVSRAIEGLVELLVEIAAVVDACERIARGGADQGGVFFGKLAIKRRHFPDQYAHQHTRREHAEHARDVPANREALDAERVERGVDERSDQRHHDPQIEHEAQPALEQHERDGGEIERTDHEAREIVRDGRCERGLRRRHRVRHFLKRRREIDLRVSIMPSIHGEDAVIRILDKQAMVEEHGGLTLDAAGFDQHTLNVLRRLVQEPYGMVLVTGPTGSGKTTTLYAALTEINQGRDKIITIEDPVEYQLPGILQIPVNDKKGLTFARGLRSILRHDPDKIMVGEIRDPETAQIAVQAALTGHQVFTTVHANNVFDVIGRFTNMDVDPYSFVSALNGVIAQRLLRQCCVDCVDEDRVDADTLARSGIDPDTAGDYLFRRGRGCAACRGSGYRGRRAVAEALRMDDELRQLLSERAPLTQIKAAAFRQGMQTLRNSAVRLVRQGETTLEEINRVTMVE